MAAPVAFPDPNDERPLVEFLANPTDGFRTDFPLTADEYLAWLVDSEECPTCGPVVGVDPGTCSGNAFRWTPAVPVLRFTTPVAPAKKRAA